MCLLKRCISKAGVENLGHLGRTKAEMFCHEPAT
jgi:hypothetical protein